MIDILDGLFVDHMEFYDFLHLDYGYFCGGFYGGGGWLGVVGLLREYYNYGDIS